MSKAMQTAYILTILALIAVIMLLSFCQPSNRSRDDCAHRALSFVTVLPFAAVDDSSRQFASLLEARLTAVLAEKPEVRVVPSVEGELMRESEDRHGHAGEALSVIRGSVARDNSRIRIQVELLQTGIEDPIQAEVYDRTVEDLDMIVDQIATWPTAHCGRRFDQ